jgi:hypothetical protein
MVPPDRTEVALLPSGGSEKWDAVCPVLSQTWRRGRITDYTLFYLSGQDSESNLHDQHSGIGESLNMSLCKIVKTRGSFPNQDATRKLLHLALKNASQKWPRPLQDWCAALNRLQHSLAGSHARGGACVTDWARLARDNFVKESCGNDGPRGKLGKPTSHLFCCNAKTQKKTEGRFHKIFDTALQSTAPWNA